MSRASPPILSLPQRLDCLLLAGPYAADPKLFAAGPPGEGSWAYADFADDGTPTGLKDPEVGSTVQRILKENPRAFMDSHIGEVNLFLSQVLGSKFEDTVGALRLHCKKNKLNPGTVFTWMDEFSLRFPVPKEELLHKHAGHTAALQQGHSGYISIFKRNVFRCSHTLAVMTPVRRYYLSLALVCFRTTILAILSFLSWSPLMFCTAVCFVLSRAVLSNSELNSLPGLYSGLRQSYSGGCPRGRCASGASTRATRRLRRERCSPSA